MTRITVRIIPNAKTNELVGHETGAWKIRLNAPPIEGRANEALIAFLSDVLDCSKSEIRIVRGLGSREKVLEIPGYVSFPPATKK